MSHEISRRLLGFGALSSAGLAAAGAAEAHLRRRRKAASPADFVHADGLHFKLKGETYRYAGANIWYGAYLGAKGPTGDRARLLRELDALQALGIRNLRVLASSELCDLKNSLDPAFEAKDTPYNQDLLGGLDFLMAEMGKRDMKAVLYLTNFWEWSGGMMALQSYVTGHYINNNDPDHPWPEFADVSAQFYKTPDAIALYRAYVKMITRRVNSITHIAYRDDPALMAWQLSNEPRPAGSPSKLAENKPAYLAWIKDTVALIRAADKHHMISLGHEGLMGCLNDSACVLDAHAEIDYLTAHIWPQNWSWVDVKDIPGTFEAGAVKVRAYIQAHIELAKTLNKPLVFEEFGFPRDDGAYAAGTPTAWRDKFYAMIYDEVEAAMKTGGPVSGSNFWAWGGSGRPLHDDFHMRRGETAYVGDPPHEPQGWYSVFDGDASTQALIRSHATRLLNAGR